MSFTHGDKIVLKRLRSSKSKLSITTIAERQNVAFSFIVGIRLLNFTELSFELKALIEISIVIPITIGRR